MKKIFVNNIYVIFDIFQNTWTFDNAKNKWIYTDKAPLIDKWINDFGLDTEEKKDDYVPFFREFVGKMGEATVTVSAFKDWDNSWTYDIELIPNQPSVQCVVNVLELRAEDTINPQFIADIALGTYKERFDRIPAGETEEEYDARLKKMFLDTLEF